MNQDHHTDCFQFTLFTSFALDVLLYKHKENKELHARQEESDYPKGLSTLSNCCV